MTHCGTFQFDDLLVSCATEIVENGFESKLIPEVIKSWICEKIVHSLPQALVKELLKGLLENRNSENTLNYSSNVIKDHSGFSVGMEFRMKVFKHEQMKVVNSKNVNCIPKDEHTTSDLFDNSQNLTEPPFFCNEILTDSYQEIPLKNPEMLDYGDSETLNTSNGSSSNLPQDDAVPSLTNLHNLFTNDNAEIHEKQKLNCVFCGKLYAQKNSLRKHFKKCHPEKYKIMLENGRNKARKPFGKFKDMLECIKCDHISTNKSTLDAHQRKHHPEYREIIKENRYKHGKLVISNEDSGDSSDGGFLTHYHKCQICKTNYKTEGELNRHQRKNHHEYYRLRQTSKAAKLEEFKCKICEKQFTRKQALQQHMFSHTGEYPYKCDVCDQGFSDAWMVKRHMKSHEKIGVKLKKYECEVCGQAFSGTWMVKRHMKTHDKNEEKQQHKNVNTDE